MGARSSPGAEETIHAPVAYPGAGVRCCEALPVKTRPRTAALLLLTLLAGPAVLAGCGEDAAETSAESSPTAQESEGAVSPSPTTEEEPSDDETVGAPAFPADAEQGTAEASSGASVTVSDIRIGHHDGYDRVVFEVGGTGTPGWDVGYVDEATSQGGGETVEVAGDAVLQVTLTGVGYPYETGVEEFSSSGPVSGSGTPIVTEAVYDATFEGTTVTFVGTTAEAPFRVFLLQNPTRVVLDVAAPS
jgi:hypothetical protein